MALIFAICIFAFFLILTAYLYKRNKPDTAETSFSNPTEPIQTPCSPFAVETTSTLPQDRKITPEFMEVANAIKRKENVILVTGGAGTGKTTLIEWLVEQGLVDVVLAFTGAAALNCHGQTIHSFFSLPLTVQDPNGSFDKSVKDAVYSIIEHAHAIVIDEISMVRADLMDAVDRRLKEVRENAAPFGGVQFHFAFVACGFLLFDGQVMSNGIVDAASQVPCLLGLCAIGQQHADAQCCQ